MTTKIIRRLSRNKGQKVKTVVVEITKKKTKITAGNYYYKKPSQVASKCWTTIVISLIRNLLYNFKLSEIENTTRYKYKK